MKNRTPIFKWLGLIAFVLGFLHHEGFYQFAFIQAPYDVWLMVGGAVIAFLLANPLKWLGLAIFVFGLAVYSGWVNPTLPNDITLAPGWVMFGGYLTLFLNSKY